MDSGWIGIPAPYAGIKIFKTYSEYMVTQIIYQGNIITRNNVMS